MSPVERAGRLVGAAETAWKAVDRYSYLAQVGPYGADDEARREEAAALVRGVMVAALLTCESLAVALEG